MMTKGLVELKQKRLKWIEANRENNFEDGIKRLLTELYPDNAHFIFELLQNAEDPRATTVRFTLTKESVEFEHDGERLFNLQDVESITSIGASTKRNDPTSIGKFGVGFKAVFAYTSTPEIHSGEFHFRIRDLVAPDSKGVPTETLNNHETRFIFPFDHPAKQPAHAAEEIERALRALGDNTLLFLTHIRKIEYLLPDGTLGSLERIDQNDGLIEIRASHPGGKATVTNWLRYKSEVDVIDEDGLTKSCQVAIAYKLELAHAGLKNKWNIVPVDHGQVSIFFPAEKETSNLKFHLHAPFASTVARDSVRDCEANNQLRDHLANLVVQSLESIRDRGALVMGFLAVLPNEGDNIPEFYEPIRSNIVYAFQNERLTPTRSDDHAPANHLYRGPARISDLLKDDGLAFLTNDAPPLWSKNPSLLKGREDRFLDTLQIRDWGWWELICNIDDIDGSDEQKIEQFENWIEQKDDSWLRKFYALLGEAEEKEGVHVDCNRIRFARVQNKEGSKHVLPEDVFFPPEDSTSHNNEVQFVKPEVFNAGRSDPQKMYARKFLESIGVRPFDETATTQLLLDGYEAKTRPRSKKEHIKDIRKFVALWRHSPETKKMFGDVPFLHGVARGSETERYRAKDLYLDEPYCDTGLAALFESVLPTVPKPKAKLSDEYMGVKHFPEFAKAIGVMYELEIEDYLATEMQENYFKKTGKDTHTTIDKDYFINGIRWRNEQSSGYIGFLEIDQFCNDENIALSQAIWRRMCGADPECLTATYVPNDANKHKKKVKSSFLVDYLKGHSWIPDRNGKFQRPSDIDKETLHPDFCFDDRNGWLAAIGFGDKAKQSREEYRAANEYAKQLGFATADDAKEIAKLLEKGLTCADLANLAAQSISADPPEGSVPNPERRKRGVLQNRDNAPAKEVVKRERSIQPGLQVEVAEAKAYLRALNKNAVGELICQCCQKEMPFTMKNGEHYFEAVLCVQGLEKQIYENRLALCPTCAAMYKYVRETDDNRVKQLLINTEEPDSAPAVNIPVRLAGKEYQIRFVGKHWFDLKTILEVKPASSD